MAQLFQFSPILFYILLFSRTYIVDLEDALRHALLGIGLGLGERNGWREMVLIFLFLLLGGGLDLADLYLEAKMH